MSGKKNRKDYQNEFTASEDRLNRIADRKHFIAERITALHSKIFKSLDAIERSKRLMTLIKERFKI
jgi:hypothetical protein